MSVDNIAYEFQRRVRELKDWPDRDIIVSVTNMAKQYISSAAAFTNVIVGTLIDPATFASYKKPLFYLIDSIMKNVGGPYAAFFTKHFAEVYHLIVKDLPEEDREKLKFLFGTWEERNFLPADLLAKMRQHLAMPRVMQLPYGASVPMNPMAVNDARRPVMYPSEGIDRNAAVYQDVVRNEMITILHQMCTDMKVTNPLTIDEIAIQNPPLFAQLKLKAEETAVEIFKSRALNIPPTSIATSLSSSSASSASSSLLYPSIQQQQQQNMLYHDPQNNNFVVAAASSQHHHVGSGGGGYDRGGAGGVLGKRPYPAAQHHHYQQQSPSVAHASHLGHTRHTAAAGYADQQQHHHNAGYLEQKQGGSLGQGGGVQGQGQGTNQLQQARLSAKLSSSPAREYANNKNNNTNNNNRNNNNYYNNNNYRNNNNNNHNHSSMPTNNNLFDTATTSAKHSSTISSAPRNNTNNIANMPFFTPHPLSNLLASSKEFTEGKVENMPVALDLIRIQTISQQLSEYTTASSSSSDTHYKQEHNNTNNNALSPALQKVALHINTLLSASLANVHVPTALPTMLLGPLPMHLAISRQQQQLQQQQAGGRNKPKHTILQAFKLSDLNNNPEIGVKRLYMEYGHQFREDGLRFKDLLSLQKHTDIYLEKKKLLLKKKDKKDINTTTITTSSSSSLPSLSLSTSTRDCREWYCNINQWITDFNTLSLHQNDTNHSDYMEDGLENNTSGTGIAGDSSGNNEEYIIPADEEFIRCPISKEVFESFFDDEEGEMMYRNAVKVIITSTTSDQTLYTTYSKPLPLDEELLTSPLVLELQKLHYMIVNKPLVVDKWLREGKVVTLRDALIRYNVMGQKGKELANVLQIAAGDEDDDDIFVILDMFS